PRGGSEHRNTEHDRQDFQAAHRGLQAPVPRTRVPVRSSVPRRSHGPLDFALKLKYSRGFTILSPVRIKFPQDPTPGGDSTEIAVHAALGATQELEARFERSRIGKCLAGTGPERGFPSAELLSPVVVELAGRHQGGVPRSREHRRPLRKGGTQPELRDEA